MERLYRQYIWTKLFAMKFYRISPQCVGDVGDDSIEDHESTMPFPKIHIWKQRKRRPGLDLPKFHWFKFYSGDAVTMLETAIPTYSRASPGESLRFRRFFPVDNSKSNGRSNESKKSSNNSYV